MSNFGHSGRPGLRGGSAPSKMSPREISFGAGAIKIRVAASVPLGEHAYAQKVYAAGKRDAAEHAIIWGGKNDAVLEGSGDTHSFVFGNKGKGFEGMSMVHNHPIGSSFSGSDLRAARDMRLASTSVITDDYVYTLTPGEGRATFADVPAADSIWDKLFRALMGPHAGGQSLWNEDRSHKIMQKVADETGMQYSRRSR